MASRWLHIPQPAPGAAVQLFCVPYAGGGSAVFQHWPAGLPGIEVAAVRLPGRESRYGEPAHRDIRPIVTGLAARVAPRTGRPYALFGHSMGARIAFEVCHELARLVPPPPRHLFASACPAPSRPPGVPTSHLPHAEFVAQLADIGAPADFLADDELVALLLPVLRADFAVVESYRYERRAPLDVPITVFGGDRDRHVVPVSLRDWAAETRARFRLHLVPGDHFFLDPSRARVLGAIRAELTGPATSTTGATADERAIPVR